LATGCIGGTAVAGLLLAGLLVMPLSGQGQPLATAPAGARPGDNRPQTLETRIRRLEDSMGAIERSRQPGDARPPFAAAPTDRLALALLHLETVVATGRPWSREWQLIIALDGPELMPPLYVEVLGSHASRGLPSARDLTERFELLAPAITERARSDDDVLQRAMNTVRATLSGVGLVAPVEPSRVDPALGGIREHLRRGELSAALTEVETLDEPQQALLAGWLAQVRARVAVEQALQDAILGLLAGQRRDG
jgi:hypothetical protein